MTSRSWRTWVALLAALVPLASWAEDPLPLTVQVALFKKIFSYDQFLEGKTVKIVVVSADDPSEGEKVAAAFRESGFQVTTAKSAALSAAVADAQIVYAMPGAMNDAVREVCVKKQALSVGSQPSLANRGEISIALNRKADGKPEIIVHLKRSKDEGHTLSSHLLNLATVIQ